MEGVELGLAKRKPTLPTAAVYWSLLMLAILHEHLKDVEQFVPLNRMSNLFEIHWPGEPMVIDVYEEAEYGYSMQFFVERVQLEYFMLNGIRVANTWRWV